MALDAFSLAPDGPDGGAGPGVAPEVLNKQPHTSASDVFGLGSTLYHLISGEPPPPGPASAIGDLPAPVPDDVRNDVPGVGPRDVRGLEAGADPANETDHTVVPAPDPWAPAPSAPCPFKGPVTPAFIRQHRYGCSHGRVAWSIRCASLTAATVNAAAQLGWTLEQVLRIAAELQGGVTRVNVMVALRNLDMTAPFVHEGLSFGMRGAEDGFLIEGGQPMRFDMTSKTFQRWATCWSWPGRRPPALGIARNGCAVDRSADETNRRNLHP